EGRRHHRLRVLDLLRQLRRGHKPDGSPPPGCGADLGCPGVGLGMARKPPPAIQPRVGRPRRPALVGAQAVRLVGRGGRALGRGEVGGAGWEGRGGGGEGPAFRLDMAPGYRPPPEAVAELALRGDEPFVMQPDGRGWLFAPSGLRDGPLPAHYEPEESPVENPLYEVTASPTAQRYDRPANRRNQVGPGFPYGLPTYRLTEHHTAGGMSRFLPFLSELQPEMFCEVSPELAVERGLVNGGWAVITSARSTIEARVLVTDRVRPVRLGS